MPLNRSLTVAALVTIGLSPGGRASTHTPQALTQSSTPSAWTIVERADATHILALFEGGELVVRQAEFEASSARVGAAGVRKIMDVPEGLLDKVVRGRVHTGDEWLIDAGSGGRFHFHVERFVLGYKDCGEGWGFVAVVAPDEAARFSAVKEQDFVGRPAQGGQPSTTATNVGPISFALSEQQRLALVDLLEAERLNAWRTLRPELDQNYSGAHDRAFVDRWRARDAKLETGQAVLNFNTQAFRMTPDGYPRLFVRATWRLDSVVVFAMSAWVQVSAELTIDHSDWTATQGLRWRSEGIGSFWNDGYLGNILNVIDIDGDGRAEVLMEVFGYESRSKMLVVYPSSRTGSLTTIAFYEDGC